MDANIKQCRICMDNSVQFVSLDTCSMEYPYKSLRENFNFCTHLNACKDDILPNVICKACLKDLNSAYEFVQSAADADARLRANLEPPKADASSILPMSSLVKQEVFEDYNSPSTSDSSDGNVSTVEKDHQELDLNTSSNNVKETDCRATDAEKSRIQKSGSSSSGAVCNICGESIVEDLLQLHYAKHPDNVVDEKIPFRLIECGKGKTVLVIQEYILLKNKIQNDFCYWQCPLQSEKMGGCNARATTKIVNGRHQLKIHTAHNHPSNVYGSKKLGRLKNDKAMKKSKCNMRLKQKTYETEEQSNGLDETVWHFGSNTDMILYDPTQPVHPRLTRKEIVCYMCGATLPNSHSLKAHVTRHALDLQLAATEPCKLIQSQKGSPLLAYKGYIFHKNRSNNGLCYWQCKLSRERLGGCKSRITTHIVNGQHHLKTHTPHNHLPKEKEVEKVEAMAEIKKIAKTTQEPTLQILDEVKSQMGCETNPEMPSVELIRKIVKRVRQSESIYSSSSIKLARNEIIPHYNLGQTYSQNEISEEIEVDQKCDLKHLITHQIESEVVDKSFDSEVIPAYTTLV